ncbi:hypothetical protein [Streptacidiphilus melanogenes]|uniref:hypothetical protein n=1 Tax=Streptacidiphilus melanogenes TaxID=411235 RepID=UPI0005A7FC3C|nr:hypothetical protein [Streptacidiphilus melanogenes]
MANLRDDPIAQANAAIRDLIESLPGGRIRPTDRPEYERLVRAWFTAVGGPDRAGDEEPARHSA